MDRLREQLEKLGLTPTDVNATLGVAQDVVDSTKARERGILYSYAEELLGLKWESYAPDDYAQLRRDWPTYLGTLPDDSALRIVYSKTRSKAYEPNSYAAISTALSTVNGAHPVRLCAFPNCEEHADKAHLCPKTGISGKTDTWLYVAAAVLGMRCDTEDDRMALSKALRGSHPVGSRSVTSHTGLNRSPFNLLLFMEQRRYFDEAPGVLVLPVLNVQSAKEWTGGPYSVIVLCSSFIRTITPSQMAVRIGLTSTEEAFVEEASLGDLDMAVATLCAVVKASAYCVEKLPAPQSHRATELWNKYLDAIHEKRVSTQAASLTPTNLAGKIPVPCRVRDIPNGKIIAKINLANMAPERGVGAYPDPLLLAYKSSINWTRQHSFQLMAEGEPSDVECPGDTGGSAVSGMSEHSIPEEVAVG